MISQACVIILGDATDSEKEDIDEIIKEHAIGYWHQFTNVWITGGHSHSFWLDTISPILSGGSSELLVLTLPKYGRGFSGYMADVDSHLEWLHKNYIKLAIPQLSLRRAVNVTSHAILAMSGVGLWLGIESDWVVSIVASIGRKENLFIGAILAFYACQPN